MDPWADNWQSEDSNFDAYKPAWALQEEPASEEVHHVSDAWPEYAAPSPDTIPANVELPWDVPPQAELDSDEDHIEVEETERSQSPFQDLQLPPIADDAQDLDEDAAPASPVDEGQWGLTALKIASPEDKLPSWGEPPPKAIETESVQDDPNEAKEGQQDGNDPWAASASSRPLPAKRSSVYMDPQTVKEIVLRARKLTEDAFKVDTSHAFAPPRGMEINLDSLLDPDGDLGPMLRAMRVDASRVKFQDTLMAQKYFEALEKTAARSQEILTGSSGAQPRRITSRGPSMFVPAVVDLNPYIINDAAALANERPAQSANFFSTLFNKATAAARPSQPTEQPRSRTPSSDPFALGDNSKRPTSPDATSTPRVSLDSTSSNESPSGVKRFFSRFSRNDGHKRDLSGDVILAPREVAVLDGSIPVASAPYRDLANDFEDTGNYALGGFLDQDSPEKARSKAGPSSGDAIDDFFSSLNTSSQPVASVHSDKSSKPFDLFDPISNKGTSALATPKLHTPTISAVSTSIQRNKQPTSTPFDIFAEGPTRSSPSVTQNVSPSTTSHRITAAKSSIPIPLLAPPPPAIARPLQPVKLMADDDFGDFETNLPASPLPASLSKSVTTSNTSTTFKTPSQQNGLSAKDLSFFDSLL